MAPGDDDRGVNHTIKQKNEVLDDVRARAL